LVGIVSVFQNLRSTLLLPFHSGYDLGEDVYVIIKAPQLTIHIRKYFVPIGEWTLHPTKRGVTLSLYEWKELKKTIPLFEDREPELRTMDNKVTGED
jgi:hypothetical protein